jgi:hypothetical protein
MTSDITGAKLRCRVIGVFSLRFKKLIYLFIFPLDYNVGSNTLFITDRQHLLVPSMVPHVP